MPAKDLGTKHICFKCGTKFYDLHKPDPLCPKCGANQRESPALKAPTPSERRARARAPEPKPAEVEVDAELEDDAELDEEAELDEPADDEG